MRLINRCFNKQLLEICQRSMQHEKLSEHLVHFLPEGLNAHCRIGNFHKGTLTLTVENTAWATQLRFMLPELRDKLRKDALMHGLMHIKINVATPDLTAQKPSSPQLSANNTAKTASKTSYEKQDGPLHELLKKLNAPRDSL